MSNQFPNPEEYGLTKLPAAAPPVLPEVLGYEGEARYIAGYWMPGGDEVIVDDGMLSFTGEWLAWLVYIGHPSVNRVLSAYNLGSSDEEAEHWLLIDRTEHKAYIGPADTVRRFLDACRPQRPKVFINMEEFKGLAERLGQEMRKAEDGAVEDIGRQVAERMERSFRLRRELKEDIDRLAGL